MEKRLNKAFFLMGRLCSAGKRKAEATRLGT